MTLQIQIRNIEGEDVSLDDCARFNKPMIKALEDSKLLSEAYVLEISSPGISNQLLNDRDFQTFKGFPVEVIYKDKKDSELRQAGLLHKRSEEHVHLNIKGRMNRIPRENVIDVRLTSPTG